MCLRKLIDERPTVQNQQGVAEPEASLKQDLPSQLLVGIFVPERIKEVQVREQHLSLIASRMDKLVQEAIELE
jgi:hypothetical protein